MKVRVTLELDYPNRPALPDVANDLMGRVTGYSSMIVPPTSGRVIAIREVPDDRP